MKLDHQPNDWCDCKVCSFVRNGFTDKTCPSCSEKDARIALLEKVVDAAREIDGCEFAERCETWMLDDLEAALRTLDGKEK
jgi:hypothetical protein